MTYTTFPTNVIGPELGFEKTTKPRIRTAGFGDGYTQETPDGINFMLSTWELDWPTLNPTEVALIENFLIARQGCQTFQWIAPDGSTYRVKARSWSKSNPYPAIYGIKTTFEEVPL